MPQRSKIPELVIVVNVTVAETHDKFEPKKQVCKMERDDRVSKFAGATFGHRDFSEPLDGLNVHF